MRWAALLAALTALASIAGAQQVTLDNVIESTCTGCQALTFAAQVNDGGERALVVSITAGCLGGGAVSNVADVSYAGQPLTFAARTRCGFGCTDTSGDPRSAQVEQWYLLNPPIGVGLVNVDVPTGSSCGASNYLLASAAALDGVNQLNPIRTTAGISGPGDAGNEACCITTTDFTIASAPGDLVVDEICSGTGLVRTAAPLLMQWTDDVSTLRYCDNHAGGTAPGAAPSLTFSWTADDDTWIEQAISVAAGDGGGGSLPVETDAGGPQSDADAAPLRLQVGCGCASTSAPMGALGLLTLLVLCRRRSPERGRSQSAWM